MAFCSNCGERLTDLQNFCPNCGKAVQHSVNAEEPEEINIAVIKCPCCGNSVSSYVARCPSCGTEMRRTSASKAVKEFADRIACCESEDEKISLISSYPVPNNREDIYDFLILASTNITSSQRAAVNEAWTAKFEQAFQKAHIMFAGDSEFARIQSYYNANTQRISKIRKASSLNQTGRKPKNLGSTLFMLSGFILSMIVLILAVRMNIADKNSSMYELLGIILLIVSACTLKRSDASPLDFVAGAASGFAALFMAQYLSNGSMFEFGGAVELIVVTVCFYKHISRRNSSKRKDAGKGS